MIVLLNLNASLHNLHHLMMIESQRTPQGPEPATYDIDNVINTLQTSLFRICDKYNYYTKQEGLFQRTVVKNERLRTY